jgi:hypothetical protein
MHLDNANPGLEKPRRLATDLRCLDTRRYEHAARCLDDTGRISAAGSNAKRPMSKRHDGLFERIANFQAPRAAPHAAAARFSVAAAYGAWFGRPANAPVLAHPDSLQAISILPKRIFYPGFIWAPQRRISSRRHHG